MRPDIFKKMCTTPLVEHTQEVTDSFSDSQEGLQKSYLCYFYEGGTRVLNSLGQEELSNVQLFLRGEDIVQVQESSKITCKHLVQQRIITKKIYYGPGEIPVIGVIYLP